MYKTFEFILHANCYIWSIFVDGNRDLKVYFKLIIYLLKRQPVVFANAFNINLKEISVH